MTRMMRSLKTQTRKGKFSLCSSLQLSLSEPELTLSLPNRLSIISSLQRIALSVIEQCHSSAQILASPSLVYDRNRDPGATTSSGKDPDLKSIDGDASSYRHSIEVVLAKRGGRPAGEISR